VLGTVDPSRLHEIRLNLPALRHRVLTSNE